MVKQLYNQKDINELKEKLLKENDLNCCLTGQKIELREAVLDHDHETQFVRGAIHRQANAALGKIENAFNRYISGWYKGNIDDFLDDIKMYLEESSWNTEYLHPHWIKKCNTEFNKLNERSKEVVLKNMGINGSWSNSKQRKESFKKALLSKKYKYRDIKRLIEDENNQNS